MRVPVDPVARPARPKSLPGLPTIAQVAWWAESLHETAYPATWRIMEDSDGAVFLIPLVDPEPAFAITPWQGEYEVTVCDPDSVDELGPFATLEAALGGISWWLGLPNRLLELRRVGDVRP